jgi:hypothetical protein
MARESKARRPCCMVSEMLEEAGVDREKLRLLRRQVLEGVILFCRWQLERIERAPRAPQPSGGGRRTRKVVVD